MPIVDVTPFVLTDCIISIDVDDYAAAINSAVFTPTSSQVTFTGLKVGSNFTGVTPATWVLSLGFAQDWAEEDSLSNYLFANEGETKTAIFKPQSGIGPSFSAEVIITPGAIGGPGAAVAVSTVNLGVLGKPTLIPAA